MSFPNAEVVEASSAEEVRAVFRPNGAKIQEVQKTICLISV
jgi:hypothetical protein